MKGLSINLATVRQQFGFAAAVDACLAQGITAISPWRDQVEAIGLSEAARIVKANSLQVTGHCRGGMFPANDKGGRDAAIDDSKRAIDEAAALGADCLVMVAGGLPAGSKDIAAARAMVADGLAAILPHARACHMPVAIEPLHPMYAGDRACVNTLEQALDLCDALGAGVGVAIDVYHTWWDPKIRPQIARAGRNKQNSRAPYLRLVGPDPRPAARPGHDGRRRDRPEAVSRGYRRRRFPRSAGGGDFLVGELVETPRRGGPRDLHRTLSNHLLTFRIGEMTHMTIFELRSPTTGELIASYPEHTPAEVEARLTRVWSGWKAWSATPLAQRVAFLNKLADGLQKRVDEFARLITKEMGKPLAEAQAEVKKAASGARHFAEAGPDYIAPQPGAWHPETSHLSIAWPGPRDHAVEFPLWQVLRFFVPAALVGNTVLVKHAENVQGCAIALEDCRGGEKDSGRRSDANVDLSAGA